MLVLNMNIRGLLKNFNELKRLIIKYNPDIITLQETFTKKIVNIKNYNVFYKNRQFFKGGGLCTYVNKHYQAHSTKFHYDYNINDKQFEVLIVKIKKGKSYLKLVNTYINPKTTTDLVDLISSFHLDKNTILLGDFNAKHPMWCVSGVTNKKGKIIKNVIKTNKLKIHNKFSTTLINNFGEKSTVDLIITQKHTDISIGKNKVLKNIGSDHFPLLFNFSCKEK